jgi:CubicO group peptidase (beta-lactamase class C family)
MAIDDITKMSSMEMIEYTTKGVKKAAVTVGIIRNGQMSYKVYGENGKEISPKEHIYEIGSITKTFTTALFSKAINENKIGLEDSISVFLNIPANKYYPTMRRLLTHTSGYKSSYYEGYVSTDFLNSGNSFYGITEKKLINRVETIELDNKDYPFEYSNFGLAVVGLVLEKIYNNDYTPLMNNYIKNELGLNNTKISDGNGDLSNYWMWDNGNPYIAAGALLSNISDMMQYAQMQMNETPSYLSLSHGVLAQVNATPSDYAELGIRIDVVGSGWMIDTVNNIIWHNGGTGNYNSYLGFDKTKGVAVVVLSNMAANFRTNATLIGATLIGELTD